MIVNSEGSDRLVPRDLLYLVVGPALGYERGDDVVPEGVTGHVLLNSSLPRIPLGQALEGPIGGPEDPLVPAYLLAGYELPEKRQARLVEEYLAALRHAILLYARPEAAVLEVYIHGRNRSYFSKASPCL